ncbi:MAG: hypothetical protein HY810_04915 [Candidatus Omnitrophica bacterium]|nr:hypothetical protein [Candidatus Omnitrophota bacterium]
MVVGAGLFFFGLIITMVLEIMAINKSVGYYTIAIGPMLLGLGIFIKGFIEYRLR